MLALWEAIRRGCEGTKHGGGYGRRNGCGRLCLLGSIREAHGISFGDGWKEAVKELHPPLDKDPPHKLVEWAMSRFGQSHNGCDLMNFIEKVHDNCYYDCAVPDIRLEIADKLEELQVS